LVETYSYNLWQQRITLPGTFEQATPFESARECATSVERAEYRRDRWGTIEKYRPKPGVKQAISIP